jgi:TolB-like protein
MATFATAHNMVECGFVVQQEFRRRGWQVRLGGHYGEVYRNESGDIVGTDVNRAARIQSAADAAAGQFLVSDVVQAIVRNRLWHIRFEPHTPIIAKGVAEALVVFEVLPAASQDVDRPEETGRPLRTTAPPGPATSAARPHTSRWFIGSAAVAAGLIVVALLYSRVNLHAGRVWRPPASTLSASGEANAIAVMEFENQRADDPKDDWYSKALQTAFNTELSKIPQLPVIAPEIIQRAARDAGLDRMAAARRLGVSRFITGSFAVLGNAMRIDARIVETANGFQEAAENVEGAQEEFFSLQKKLALATLEHFRVRLTEAQAESLSKATNSRLDKYRMLLEAEGVTDSSPTSTPTPEGPRAGWPALESQPQYRTSWGIVPGLLGVAHAQAPTTSAETVARPLLEEYRRAHEAGDLDHLASLYVSFPESQRKALGAYLKDVQRLRVELVDVKIQPSGDDIAVSYTRRDNFIDKESGEPVSLEVRVTKFLVQDHGKWKFADGG